MISKKSIVSILFCTMGLSSCSGIDCPLDSVVVWTLRFFDSTLQEETKLPCSLTVNAEGTGTLYNKGQNIASMSLPMSLSMPTDTLYLNWSEGTYSSIDTLYVEHTNHAHFEAIDCPAAVFHDITTLRYLSSSVTFPPITIDSIRIIRPQVDYKDVENIRIYLHHNSLPDANVDTNNNVSNEFYGKDEKSDTK